jgi:metallo-beta-lactamase family protein
VANPDDTFARIIRESIDRGGVLIIPAFAVGRTQSLLYAIRELEEKQMIPSVPIYVDSPMAIDATEVFQLCKGDYDLEAKVRELQGKSILQPKQVHFTRSRKESMAINAVHKEATIISASGMITGGRILHHLVERLPDPRNTVLFAGFQAEGTRGRAISDGLATVRIHGQEVPVRAHIEITSGFSGHADYQEILAWLMGFNRPPEKTFLVHGEAESSEALAEKIRRQFGWDVEIPTFGDRYDLNL